MPQPNFFVGKIVGKHGFKGFVVIDAHTDEIIPEEYLFLEIQGKGVPFFVLEVKKGNTVLFKYVDTEEKATEIVGISVFSNNTYYQEFEFVKFTFEDVTSGLTGIIEDMEEYPQGTMWICTVNKQQVLIPQVEEWITKLDDKKHHLQLTLPTGLLTL